MFGQGVRKLYINQSKRKPPQHRLGSKDPRVTSSQAFTTANPRGEHKPMQPMQWQEHTKWSSPSLPNSNKATNAYGGIRDEEQRGESQRTPRPRSTEFPSLCGEIDWWKYGSRSPLTFPQRYARIMGGSERKADFSKVNNGGERGEKRAQELGKKLGLNGEEDPLNSRSKNWPLEEKSRLPREPSLGPALARQVWPGIFGRQHGG